jgi:hypothetical protein
MSASPSSQRTPQRTPPPEPPREDIEERSVSTDPEFRRRLSSFFRYYEPTQLRILDKWLRNWAGRERMLMAELVRFHGPEPDVRYRTDPNAALPVARSLDAQIEDLCRSLLQQTLLLYSPERLAETDRILRSWDGQHRTLLARLQRQVSMRDHVYTLIQQQHPDQLQEVAPLLRQWLGREGELVRMLGAGQQVAGDGRPPARTADKAAAAAAANAAADKVPLPFASYREQLTRFYRLYNPERIGDVDAILEAYEGREPVLFRKLYKKYCKAPEGDTANGGQKNDAPAVSASTTAEADAAAAEKNPPADVATAPETASAQPSQKRHVAVRHLMAANTLESTAMLEEFMRTFEGTDAEMAWALRHYCRGGTASPPTKLTTHAAMLHQVAKLEKKASDLRGTVGTDDEDEHQRDEDVSLLTEKPDPAFATREQRLFSMQGVLAPLGLGHLAASFVDQDITIDLLPSLTATDLRELGVEPELDRRFVMQRLRRLGAS